MTKHAATSIKDAAPKNFVEVLVASSHILKFVAAWLVIVVCVAALWRFAHPIEPVIKVCYKAGSCAPALNHPKS